MESRLLMAGNVTVSVTDGDLVVTGDAEANEIEIIQSLQNGVPIAGRFFITGQNGTRINGQTAGQLFQNVNDDFSLNFGAGRDVVKLGNGVVGDFIVPDDLVITMGDGNDLLTLDRIAVRDDALIITGNGGDTIVAKVTVGVDPGVDNGNNDLTIDTGNNLDTVILQHTFVRRNLGINTGTDIARDVVDFLFMNVGNNTQINTFGGNDTVRMEQVGFNGDLNVDTGAGTDRLTILSCEVDELFASLGAGSDTLEMTDTFGRRATLNGGTEADTLVQSGNSFSELFQTNSF